MLKNLKGKKIRNLLDIGCHDLYAIRKIKDQKITENIYGIDKKLLTTADEFHLYETRFPLPENLHSELKNLNFDCIISLATFEHIELKDLPLAASQLADLLSEDGSILLTVPSPHVDFILEILAKLNVIDASEMDAESHHHLSIDVLKKTLSAYFKIEHSKFQLGLNNYLALTKI